MKKVLKSGLAAGAAAALLLGGAGTFALWQGSGNIDAGTVSTGHLTLDTTTTPGTWADVSADVLPANAAFDPATQHIVPGDTVEFSQTVKISADGKNLKGALTVGTLAAIPAALQPDVTVTVAATASGTGISAAGNVITFTEPGTYSVPVTITVAFAKGTTGSTLAATMNQPIALDALALTLNQTRP
ncbi:alternate-type signal peptide domain-containing protein [Arthrobacter sp. ERGS1:01]|uniref:alternate-type signal peptide domain-containing protein n=1 Tax=Arthrobacter sp. ERGS1:01 TaxID=1704044 RepID=UPI0006B60BF3|nr:alternate-type signal peptide domain-containing protein [Arthrobacter sp. ERGS1:01]